MREPDIRFLEEYKKADNFIKDANMTQEGISWYIRQMELSERKGAAVVRTWQADYRMLKHVRWVRNKLVHEVEYDAGICGAAEYNSVKDFGERLCAAEDPLAVLGKYLREERRKKIEAERAKNTANRTAQAKSGSRKQTGASQTKKKETFWQKLKRFFTED